MMSMSLINLAQVKQGNELQYIATELVKADITEGFDPDKIKVVYNDSDVSLSQFIVDNDLKLSELHDLLQSKIDNPVEGKSAYDLAIESGTFTGTEVEWLESLKGEDGGTGVSNWSDIQDLPSSFKPEAHGHLMSEVEGLTTALDNKVEQGAIDTLATTVDEHIAQGEHIISGSLAYDSTTSNYNLIVTEASTKPLYTLRFKATADYGTDTTFSVNSVPFEAVNPTFKANEIKLVTVDVEQAKIFFIDNPSANQKISADNVVESSTRVFVTPEMKDQVLASSTTISEHSQQISDINNTLDSLNITDELVKMDELSEAKYLGEMIDNNTLVDNGGRIGVQRLDGLTATLEELNHLQGVTMNVQEQITALGNIGSFKEAVATKEALDLVTDMELYDLVFVLTDEEHEGVTTVYLYSDTGWNFIGEFKGGELRDFTAKPINLSSEVTGILPRDNYEAPNASDIVVTDTANNFSATRLEDILIEIFQFARQIKSIANIIGDPLSIDDTSEQLNLKMLQLKEALANAISQKGVPTYSYDTLTEMANKILAIPNIILEGTMKSVTKLNVTAPYSHDIVLSEGLRIEDIATSVLKLIGNDSNISHYTAEYNNSESGNFVFEEDEVMFDGFMRIRDVYDYPLNEISENYFETEVIDFANDFIEYGDDAVVETGTNPKISIKGIKYTETVVKGSGDILLAGISSIDQLIWSTTATGAGVTRIAMSFDSGVTYNAWDGTQWVLVDVDNKVDFKNKGMDSIMITTLDKDIIQELRGTSDVLRFAYYMESPSYTDTAENDRIELKVTASGTNTIADNSAFDYTYDVATKTLTYSFKESGTYTINYVDAF